MGAQGAKHIDSGNEWATPRFVVDEAASMIGGAFDLDPAATRQNAQAPAFFDRETNGLEQEWFGRVWLNPPFSRSMKACVEGCQRKTCRTRGAHLLQDQHGAADFAQKCVEQLTDRNVTAIAWHGPVAPDTDWYAALWPWVHYRIDYGFRICYNGESSGGTFPSQTLILLPYPRVGAVVPTILSVPCVTNGPEEQRSGP